MYYNDELYHYGVVGMKWGHHRSNVYQGRIDRHMAKAQKLQAKADAKRHNMMNSTNRRIKYATKEQRYANAERFHNKKALGLSYGSKLLGSTMDYKANKKLASRDAIMKEKYSEAKTGTTNRINRLEYRARKQLAKANKAVLKKKVRDLKNLGAGKDKINKMLDSSIGKSMVSTTWTATESNRDRKGLTNGYVRRKQRVL